MTLETMNLGLLLVVLLSYRRRFRAPLGIRYLLLTMWYPEPTLTLHFIFYNAPSFFYLDDVCVTPSGGGGSPTPTPTVRPVESRPIRPTLV